MVVLLVQGFMATLGVGIVAWGARRQIRLRDAREAPWLWMLPALVPLALTALSAAHMARSAWSAWLPVSVELLSTAFLAAVVALRFAVRVGAEPAGGESTAGEAGRRRGARRRQAMAAAVVAAGFNLSFLLYCLALWGRLPSRPEALPMLPLLVAFGAALVLQASAWTGERGYVVQRRDPRLVVETPSGAGWAINLGHPLGWLVAALFLAMPAVPLLLGTAGVR
ncbi:MAG: DUF5808 domain-containing protein [Firmicutes bacterium]|nr:DUF5808 domain-containing protein [Bacillota bacterium]